MSSARCRDRVRTKTIASIDFTTPRVEWMAPVAAGDADVPALCPSALACSGPNAHVSTSAVSVVFVVSPTPMPFHPTVHSPRVGGPGLASAYDTSSVWHRAAPA